MKIHLQLGVPVALCLTAFNAAGQGTELFSPGAEITELSAGGDAFSPTLDEDELTMVFASTRASGSFDLFETNRGDIDQPWGPPTPIPQLSSADDEYGPHITYNTDPSLPQELHFASSRGYAPGIYVSYRPDPGAPWSPPQMALPGLVEDPFLTQDGLTMFFGQDGDIHTAVRAGFGAPWQPQGPLPPPINGPDYEHSPHPEGNGDIFWFASDRAGGAGQSDFYLTYRPSSGSPYLPPIHVDDLNTGEWESNAWCGGITGRWYLTRYIFGIPRIFIFCRIPIVTWIKKCLYLPIPKPIPFPPWIIWCRQWVWSIRVPRLRWFWFDWWPGLPFLWPFISVGVLPGPGIQLPGFASSFMLNPGQLAALPPVPLQGNGLATVELPIPPDPALVGLTLSMQTAGLDPATGMGAFSEVGQVTFSN
ncbi:MAG: hypothetical protein AAF628_06710 [Planctomycetota bacterium]